MSISPVDTQQERSVARRILGITTEGLLWIASTLGVLCILLAVLGAFFGFRVMLFSTGSMEPTIPVGSAALVHTVSADDLEVGDVVTVDRDAGELPVTHRIIEISDSVEPSHRELVLQGDANEQPDPLPYEVAEAGKLLFSIPNIAPIISSWGSPRVLGPLGFVAAGFVIWGLWPRKEREES